MIGIEKTKELMNSLGNIVLSIVDVMADGKISFSDVGKIMAACWDLKKIVLSFKNAREILAELKDIDGEELGELGEILVQLISKIVGK